MKQLLIVLVPFICTILLLVFWRYFTKWNGWAYSDRKFPTLFHIVVLSLVSLIPIVGIFVFLIILTCYLFNRITGAIEIKSNKFTRFWFDIDKEK